MSNAVFTELLEMFKDPNNQLTPDQKMSIKNISGNVENAVKASIINLLMGQFSKISVYDAAIGQVIQILATRAAGMDTEELISFLGVLSKVNASESKTVLELFKKQDNDFGKLMKELQKLTKSNPSSDDDMDSFLNKREEKVIELSPEKREKVLKYLNDVTRTDNKSG
jgi:hypothetical protein